MGLTRFQPMQLALQLTLLDLLLEPIGPWWMRWAILLLAAAGLLLRSTLVQPWFWLCLASLTGLRVIVDWPLADNHAYLLSYWCLACGLACLAEDPAAALARNGRWLIGLAFLGATVWKLAPGGDYASGVFFRVTMVIDPRLEGFARVAGGLSMEQIDALRSYLSVHWDGGSPPVVSTVQEPTRFVVLAHIAAWWNIALNGAIALAFLWPQDRGLSRLRNVLLLLFCVVTYAVATVASFGWLLIAMAVSQTRPEDSRTRYAYAAVFGLILLYREIPWSEAIILPLLRSAGG